MGQEYVAMIFIFAMGMIIGFVIGLYVGFLSKKKLAYKGNVNRKLMDCQE